tara:strand:+ start:188 stop:466 length:279 start_codon:yes stop_codon:yes gene_type:complete
MGLRIICPNLVQVLNLEAIIQIQNQAEIIQNQVEIIIIQDLAMITNLLILDILLVTIPDLVIVHHRLVHPEVVRLVRPEVVRLEVVKLVNKN